MCKMIEIVERKNPFLGGLKVPGERVWKPVQHATEESREYCIAYLGEYRHTYLHLIQPPILFSFQLG